MAKSDWNTEDFHFCVTLIYKNKFVARFKHNRARWKDFRNFLVANFTPEEYFSRIENNETPLGILESKGYVLPHIRKELKRLGYPVTVAGFKQMIRDKMETRNLVSEN